MRNNECEKNEISSLKTAKIMNMKMRNNEYENAK